MGVIVELFLFSVLCASVGVQAVCRSVENNDMIEYSCIGGQLSDLNDLPPNTGRISISNMPVRRITADTFSRFGSDLWVLGCSHCGITDIEPGAFQRLTDLQQLSLDNNHLTTVQESWFRGLEYLTFLDLNYNKIEHVDKEVFRNLPNIIEIRLSGNRLECLNLESVALLKDLQRIFLNENPQFKCPNALSTFLENRGVTVEKDPEWSRLPNDLINFELPSDFYEDNNEEITSEEPTTPLPFYRERLHPTPMTPIPTEASTPYVPSRFYTTEEVVYPPPYTPPTHSPYDYTRGTFDPPTTASRDSTTRAVQYQETTTLRPWPYFAESTSASYGNEDGRYAEHPDYSTPSDSHPLATFPVDQTPPYVEFDAQRTSDYPPTENRPALYRDPSVDSTRVVQTPPVVEVQAAWPGTVYQPPYYEHPVSVHPPPGINQPQQEEVTPVTIEITTTDKPLPKCANLSSSIRNPVTMIVVLLATYVLVEGF